MGDVVALHCQTTLDVPMERVLGAAAENTELENVIIIGVFKNGDTYLASGIADHREVLWRLEAAKRILFNCSDSEEA